MLTHKIHEFVPALFTVLKARNRGQYDVAKHILFQFHHEVDALIKDLSREQKIKLLGEEEIED